MSAFHPRSGQPAHEPAHKPAHEPGLQPGPLPEPVPAVPEPYDYRCNHAESGPTIGTRTGPNQRNSQLVRQNPVAAVSWVAVQLQLLTSTQLDWVLGSWLPGKGQESKDLATIVARNRFVVRQQLLPKSQISGNKAGLPYDSLPYDSLWNSQFPIHSQGLKSTSRPPNQGIYI
jgi:hypothetical protein